VDDTALAGGQDLPLLTGGVRPERADAARNRRKVLLAAADLFARRGVVAVVMDEVAAAAGVGKGTLYRRFGDKSGLAAALLDERESGLQEAMLTGAPPLGPGAPPAERLAAFAAAYLAFVDAHLDLVALSQTASPGARLRTGSHRLWRHHCTILLTSAGVPAPEVRADTLLAALTAEQVRHWRRDENHPLPALTEAIVEISRRLCTS
jgi:AcrR family transcriptional regulator